LVDTPSLPHGGAEAEDRHSNFYDTWVNLFDRRSSGPSLAASETVRSGAKYRFSVSPGSYRVTGWWGTKGVTVRAGHRVTADFFDACD